ncbi:MAG: hypothetical protein KDA41_00695, partial [Planctomycetales bacterium]|nr:hypothetical protein [Planctomycetales bacterium]
MRDRAKLGRTPRRRRTVRRAAASSRRLRFEALEPRLVMDGVPYGALPTDTSEYMIGSVTATVVLLESDGTLDASTEDWTTASINSVKSRIDEALAWWETQFDALNTVHDLVFDIDYQFADAPVATVYEPVARSSLDFDLWMNEFLDGQSVAANDALDVRMREFNHAQRLAHGTNWAFTIFVVNALNDADHKFELGGARQAFAVPEAGTLVVTSERPASAIAHETAHMFWAMDEYSGGKSYYDTRGYYNTQNT